MSVKIIPFASKRTASGELPVLRPDLGGSVKGATEQETQKLAAEANPSRVLMRAVCECGHAWQAPTIGRCPACGGAAVRVLAASVCMAQRL